MSVYGMWRKCEQEPKVQHTVAPYLFSAILTIRKLYISIHIYCISAILQCNSIHDSKCHTAQSHSVAADFSVYLHCLSIRYFTGHFMTRIDDRLTPNMFFWNVPIPKPILWSIWILMAIKILTPGIKLLFAIVPQSTWYRSFTSTLIQ